MAIPRILEVNLSLILNDVQEVNTIKVILKNAFDYGITF